MKMKVALAAGMLFFARSSAGAETVDYLRDVKPILAERCASCHGAVRQKGGLRLDTAALIRRGGESGPAVEPGQSAESLLIERVTAGAQSTDRMPPPSEGVELGAHEVGILRTWIDQGAVAPAEAVPPDPRRHWAYLPPVRPPVPPPGDQGWPKNPIDAFLAAAHRSQGLHAAPPVSNDLLLRRVYLDLAGLPPTRAELRAFCGDQSPGAYEKVVDQLLASPRYGERWGRHWMDVWRYSDWYGLGEEVRYSHPHIWQWRDWIVAALNADKGYDQMVVEMLAADELKPDDPAAARATGFLVRNWDIFNRNTWLGNTVEHTARAFLGVTIQCARCHDHKFDPVSQSDYYRLRAFFEPMHIRIDRVPGQPDRAKSGLPRVFDDFVDTPTFLYSRGDETRPDRRPLTPATPAVLGGELHIVPVHLPIAASSPDKRDFVIREAIEAGEQATRSARTSLAQARQNLVEKTQSLKSAVAQERQTQSTYQAALGAPDKAKQARQPAIVAVATLARARLEADDAQGTLAIADSALALAELRQEALQAVLRVERLEDQGAPRSSGLWIDAAHHASTAQKKLAVHEAGHNCLLTQRAMDRSQRTVNGLTAAGDPAKDPGLQAAILKSSAEVVDAGSKLDAARKELAKAEAAAQAAPTPSYTPRPLVYHRAKTSFRDVPPNNPYPAVSTGRRLALARWITGGKNPLTARVAVNHIWMRHFGEPLVASTFDFGLRTKRPEHHDLLDWLAVELIESGWSMKHIHRLIVTSRTYQMQSAAGPTDAESARIDPDNQYVWRMNVRRMESEVIRDSLLHLAGRLDTRLGGTDLPLASAETTNRRSIYYRYARGDRIPFLVMFDAPSVEECYRRDETIVPQQALALTNSGIALARAAEIAAAIDKEVGESDAPEVRSAFVISAFERVLGRTPTDGERAESASALERLSSVFASEGRAGPAPHLKARAALVHVLVNHNDFVSIR
jgi:Protein of unknown function (DUF1553)/Protein of unknown function (DUF1549)/Planctomycete cytochrome C